VKKIIALAAMTFVLAVGTLQIVKADLVCEGQWSSASDCQKKSGGVFIQGVPLQQTDCTNTCENHGGFKHTDCGTIDSYAAKICGNRPVEKKYAFPGASGNKCGYAWWAISCQ
jgi:hypothetical protein